MGFDENNARNHEVYLFDCGVRDNNWQPIILINCYKGSFFANDRI